MLSPSANIPVWRIKASVSVVLPWSTWAMMAMFRISIPLEITYVNKIFFVSCPQKGYMAHSDMLGTEVPHFLSLTGSILQLKSSRRSPSEIKPLTCSFLWKRGLPNKKPSDPELGFPFHRESVTTLIYNNYLKKPSVLREREKN